MIFKIARHFLKTPSTPKAHKKDNLQDKLLFVVFEGLYTHLKAATSADYMTFSNTTKKSGAKILFVALPNIPKDKKIGKY